MPENIWNKDIPKFLSEYSSLFYLNEDYEGGELIFPDYELSIKPEAGTLITFPTNSMYQHAVNKVESGTRYNIALRWFRKTTLIANTIPRNKAIEDVVKYF